MNSVEKKYGVQLSANAIGVNVSSVEVDEDGEVCAEFDFYVKRWRPEFWVFAARMTVAVLRGHGVDLLSLHGAKCILRGMRDIFAYYHPDNANGDVDDSQSEPWAHVSMSDIPVPQELKEAFKDVSPRWFIPHPSKLKN